MLFLCGRWPHHSLHFCTGEKLFSSVSTRGAGTGGWGCRDAPRRGCFVGVEQQQNPTATENKMGFLLTLDSADLNLRGLANVQLLSFWQQVKITQTEVEYLLDRPAGPHPAPSASRVALLRLLYQRICSKGWSCLVFCPSGHSLPKYLTVMRNSYSGWSFKVKKHNGLMTLIWNKYSVHLCQPRFLLCMGNKNLPEPDRQPSELAQLPLHPQGFPALHQLKLCLGLFQTSGAWEALERSCSQSQSWKSEIISLNTDFYLKKWEKVGLQDRASWAMVGFALVLVFVTNMLGDFKRLTLFAWSLFPLLHYSTVSISIKAKYNEINLLYETFLIWQLDINSEIKIGYMSMPTVD